MRKGSGWMSTRQNGTGNSCSSCGKDVASKPAAECQAAQHSLYYESRRNSRTAISHRSYWRARLAVIKLLGGHCRKCSVTDPRILQINHKNGGGTKERSTAKLNSGALNRAILSGERSTEDLELLCANCNIIFEYEQGNRSLPSENTVELKAA